MGKVNMRGISKAPSTGLSNYMSWMKMNQSSDIQSTNTVRGRWMQVRVFKNIGL